MKHLTYWFRNRGITLILVLVPIFLLAEDKKDSTQYVEKIFFNPDFFVVEQDEKVTLMTSDQKGNHTEYSFDEFDSDLILLCQQELTLLEITEKLGDMYKMKDDECRRKIKHSLNILAEWKIIERRSILVSDNELTSKEFPK